MIQIRRFWTSEKNCKANRSVGVEIFQKMGILPNGVDDFLTDGEKAGSGYPVIIKITLVESPLLIHDPLLLHRQGSATMRPGGTDHASSYLDFKGNK
jgi:hypothetical protein